MERRTFPNCKINLGLQVVGKRPDGYHNLETIFLPVYSLRDELEITPLSDLSSLSSLSLSGIALETNAADNLCLRAYNLLKDDFPKLPPVHIQLRKAIPFGAGLGGGSSDAAFTLKMLNDMFSLGLTTSQLEQRAARLGADCAFFIQNRPAYATGIGDILSPIELDLGAYHVIIEIPDGEHVSTKEAYAGVDLSRLTSHVSLKDAIKRPIEEWRDLIVNDFEASVFPSHPTIAALKESMYARGALYASMTGSGAAVFGIFAK